MEKKYRDLCILLIFSFCSIVLIFTFVMIDRYVLSKSSSDCNCSKCEVKDNKVINDNKDDSIVEDKNDDREKLVWKNHYSINCSKIEDDLCFINSGSYEIILSEINGIEQISIDNNIYKLSDNQKLGNVYILSDGYVFVSFYGFGSIESNAFILDTSAHIVNNFKDYFDNNYEYNGASYQDGYIDIYSTIGIHSTSVCIHGLNFSDNDIVEKIIRYEYDGNGKVKNPITKKETSFSNYLKEQSGYTNCNDFLNANPYEG